MWEVNTPISVSNMDSDLFHMGFMNSSAFLTIADKVCERVLTGIGLGEKRAISSGITVFTAAANVINYKLIGQYDTFCTEVIFTEIGNKKFITKTLFYSKTGDKDAEVETVHVCYDLKLKKTVKIPDDVLENLSIEGTGDAVSPGG